MTLDRVHMKNFRNYTDEMIMFDPGINVITGQNAQGKTALLEGIYLLSCGHSFRTRFDKEIISFDCGNAKVSGDVSAQGRKLELEIALSATSRKQISCNGVKRNANELSELFRVVLFCPDDLNTIKDGASARRRFLDMAISQLRPAYAQLISEYSRLYEQKKRILGDWREKPSLLSALDEYSASMCMCSAKIIRYRAAFSKRLAEVSQPIHSEFSGSGEELLLSYVTISTVTDPLAPIDKIFREISEHQEKHKDAEIASGKILTGTHKDELDIKINGVSARTHASQGQMRTSALSLKMAEREISYQDTGETPVLLLDDVLSELDPKRQEFVLNRIGGGQTLITCCEDEQIKKRTGGKVIMVSGGRIVKADDN